MAPTLGVETMVIKLGIANPDLYRVALMIPLMVGLVIWVALCGCQSGVMQDALLAAGAAAQTGMYRTPVWGIGLEAAIPCLQGGAMRDTLIVAGVQVSSKVWEFLNLLLVHLGMRMERMKPLLPKLLKAILGLVLVKAA